MNKEDYMNKQGVCPKCGEISLDLAIELYDKGIAYL